MSVDRVAPDVDTFMLLPGAQFVDAFRIVTEGSALDAHQAAQRILGSSPRWIRALTAMRNLLVSPLGLKTSGAAEPRRYMIGMFPVVSEAPERIVAGFNDRHLDFRIVIDVATSGGLQRITATTVVLTHNRLGRMYLGIILPFHRLVVPAMLRQVTA